MATRIFSVDGNWYLHRCWFTLRTNRPIEEALPYNMIGLIMKDACAVKATHILVAFDGPQVFRHAIFPEYKANRKEKKAEKAEQHDGDEDGGADIYSYLPAVRAGLETAGIVWIQPKKHEADDVNASAGHQYGALKNTTVILGCRDKDVYQSLRANVKAYDSTQEPPRFITMDMAEKSKGVLTSQMVMYQTLIGDKIDNIPTLKPPAKAKQAIKLWGSFKAWFEKGTKEDKIWLRANQVKLSLNRKLVEMDTKLILPDLHELKMPKLDRKDMPKSWYVYQSWLYPKSKGLFKR